MTFQLFETRQQGGRRNGLKIFSPLCLRLIHIGHTFMRLVQ